MTTQRKIIHIDCDCFYAAIEMRDDPSLANIPIAVGGTGRRGVIATCNYPARKYGVHSAMASQHALRLCPDLKLLPARFDAYKQASAEIMAIFNSYTDLVQPLSLDEAYLDVSDCELHQGSATLIAEAIRAEILQKVGITVSAGVSSNKFVAKVASDWNKPNGIKVVPPDEIDAFVARLDVRKIPGVGPVTADRLKEHGIEVCLDIRQIGQVKMVELFGQHGAQLYQLSLGVDDRKVSLSRLRKSISVERTFEQDLESVQQCLEKLPALSEELTRRLAKLPADTCYRKQFVKIKFNDFTQTTIEMTGTSPDESVFTDLLEKGWERRKLPVRLLGIGLRLDQVSDFRQLNLFS